MVTFKKYFSLRGLWLLFSVCAFPIHVWSLILFFRDFSWISERTKSWDAIGVGSYGLLIAFIESIFVFVITVVLSFFLPSRWSEIKRIAMMGFLSLVVAAWTIGGQLYFLLEFHFPISWIHASALARHPLWILYGILLVVISSMILVPSYCIIKFEILPTRIYDFFDRLATLTSLYLFLDICGVIIVIIRNV